jgi:2,4-dienoyl-CoA reductase-like NADH-dependent reductase (Old Yellow Enzyme family)
LKTYDDLAKGGAGTIITGYTLIDEAEKNFPPMLALYNDLFIEEHKKLVDLAHKNGANIILQLVYIGSYTSEGFHKLMKERLDAVNLVAPSAEIKPQNGIRAKALTIAEIKNIQTKFAAAANRAKSVGYDAIEIHAAHGFLLSQFMTPSFNKRGDQYGGSVENRARMAIETYEKIRSAVGGDFPIFIKINACDGIEDGVTTEDVLYLAKELDRRGIDAIEISGDWHKFASGATSFFKSESAQIAAHINAPVIMTGGNRDFNEMSDILNATKIAYFGISRALIKNPNLINEFQETFATLYNH